MITFPNAKINIGLNILRKRTDNYHDLQSIFIPIPLKDALEVVENKENNKIEFFNTGLQIDSPEDNNLVIKAYNLLKKDFDLPFVKIHLHKVIPFGAGLGGGSADATFMLKMLNDLFSLKLTDDNLKHYTKKIGADCTFFLSNKSCFATEKGDVLEPINFDFSKFQIVLIKPNINLNTAKMYSYITPNESVTDLRLLIKKPIEEWKNFIFNDFEKVITQQHKEIEEIKTFLYKSGAFFSAMSGSGSSVFGLFADNYDCSKIKYENSFVWNSTLKF